MPIDRRELLSDLRRQLRLLERDLAARADSMPEMAAALEAEYQAARAAERTAATFRVWRAGELTQAAVAWLLGAVFVRFIEDNDLDEEYQERLGDVYDSFVRSQLARFRLTEHDLTAITPAR